MNYMLSGQKIRPLGHLQGDLLYVRGFNSKELDNSVSEISSESEDILK